MRRRSSIGRPRLMVAVALTVVGLTAIAVDRWRSGGESSPSAATISPTVVVPAGSTTSTTRFAPDPVPYLIQAGESLFDIAIRNGLTVDELARFNGIKNPNDVQADQMILIPPPSPTTTTSSTRPRGPTTTTTVPIATTLPDDPAPTTVPLAPGETTTTLSP